MSPSLVTRRHASTVPVLLRQIAALQLPQPTPEYRFHPVRQWRFDVAFLPHLVAVEVDGGGFVAGRHSRGVGMERDAEKFAEALLLGWRILRVTPKQVTSGQAVRWIELLLQSQESGRCL
jgi:very-short-patch-repair endonuclease